ncbi:hypothetical protein ADL03_27615 [Nocardia sp. NRRL S-836]|nr:hypothetical protein ADL03_27615 [Nocardia sp. NRRL S-836]
MHEVTVRDRRLGSFRLQIYTADGLRPVVIVTQDATSEGCSLVNGAERYAASVWRTHFTKAAEPPLWVQNMQMQDSTMLALVAFDVGTDYTLSDAIWDVIDPTDLQRLVGADVDLRRGQRPAPASKPVYRTKFIITPVANFPPGKPFRARRCMPPMRHRRWRHLLARLRPAPAPASCCWYHGGDWRTANATALRLLATTPMTSADPGEWPVELCEAVDAAGITGWQRQAVQSLFLDPIVLEHEDNGRLSYGNGQHRGRAMHDAGVARTITAVDELYTV